MPSSIGAPFVGSVRSRARTCAQAPMTAFRTAAFVTRSPRVTAFRMASSSAFSFASRACSALRLEAPDAPGVPDGSGSPAIARPPATARRCARYAWSTASRSHPAGVRAGITPRAESSRT